MALRQRSKTAVKTNTESSKSTVVALVPRAPSHEAIATRAYEIWQESGGAHGNDQAHWLQAERELSARPTLR